MTGEPLSLSRWLGVGAKDLKEKLGDPKSLPSVTGTLEIIEQNKSKRYDALQAELKQRKSEQLRPLLKSAVISSRSNVKSDKLCKKNKISGSKEN